MTARTDIRITQLTGTIGAAVDGIRLADVDDVDFNRIRSAFLDHSTRPDRVYRHRWSNGDVVMWDNRCTMHYAVHDHGDDARRELHRISIVGDRPY